MFHRLIICLTVLLIGLSTGHCEEVSYVFEEDGGRLLSHSNRTEYDGSDTIKFNVAGGVGGNDSTGESERTVASIKREIDGKVDVEDPDVRDLTDLLTATYPGNCRIDQICYIYDHLREDWDYINDPKGVGYYSSASRTIGIGDERGRAGAGDCDDFAILMSALVENIGVSTRIILAYGPSGGHAYTEAYLGKIDAEDRRVERIQDWIRNEYDINEVQVHIDMDTGDVWLNLDWSAEHPGGPFYRAEKHVPIYVGERAGGVDGKVPVKPLNEPPLVIVSYEPKEPNAGEFISFDGSRSYDPYGSITDYEWDFGDGATAKGGSIEHSYSEGGIFTVSLTVTDDENATNANFFPIKINKPPVALFTYSPLGPKAGDEIAFDASQCGDEDGTITDYEWEFGDGYKAKGSFETYHSYRKSGKFVVNLTVTDEKGSKSSDSVQITVGEYNNGKRYTNGQINSSLRKVGSLLDSRQYEEAIGSCEDILGGISCKESPYEYALVQNYLGIAYHDLALVKNKEGNLHRSIHAYEEALKIYTVERYPIDYAMSQNNLGIAHITLAEVRNREENLNKAIEAYEKALNIYTVENYPVNYATTQNNLGIAHRNLAEVRNREENLNKAIEAYEKALRIRTVESYPVNYATTQNNLGVTYQTLAEVRDREENLNKAIEAYEKALNIYTVENYPVNYATTQNNLGIVYRNLAEVQDREENLNRAIEAYEKALDIYTVESHPVDYAMTQNNLGIAHRNLAQVRDREENLNKAIEAYERALDVYTAESHPVDYAMTQNNLGVAYRNLAEVHDREENLNKAIEAYERALDVYTIKSYPVDYSTTQNNLGVAYQNLAEVRDREENLKKAIGAYEKALMIFTPEEYPAPYETVMSNLELSKQKLTV